MPVAGKEPDGHAVQVHYPIRSLHRKVLHLVATMTIDRNWHQANGVAHFDAPDNAMRWTCSRGFFAAAGLAPSPPDCSFRSH
jgi:hypothetical protein